MPDHVHFIGEQINKNGKETAQCRFLKYTAHEFIKKIKENSEWEKYKVNAFNKKHKIWQRDSLSVKIYCREIARQVGLYSRPNGLPGGHFNPVSGGWNSAKDDLNYYFSSARFYKTGIDEFGSLNNLYAKFDGDKNFVTCATNQGEGNSGNRYLQYRKYRRN